MQQVIDFIIRKKDVVIYIVLLLFSLTMIVNSNYFHKSKTLIIFNNITNYTFEKFTFFNEYFELKKLNSDLFEENLLLKSEIEKTIKYKNIDSLKTSKFKYKNARIISNSLSSFKNQIIINKGSKEGLKKEMGVINANGVVGIIKRTSQNYSTIMSLLNTDIKINAKVKRTNNFGTLEWNGEDINFLSLNDIPETANIRVGDSIVTGGMSLIFPEGINIGIVSKVNSYNLEKNKLNQTTKTNQNIKLKSRENYLNIEVKLHSDMGKLNNVYIIESMFIEEFNRIKENG
ncbi:MAG: rod shape-determining protein MreC [Cryomorphaceae bacterium]|nr:MAG: rod shape-determining protein MreC [Cryomorphaceae bacterium]